MININRINITNLILVCFLACSVNVNASDYDDGMSADGGFDTGLSSGGGNKAFRSRNTKQKVATGRAIVLDPCAGSGNMNFVGTNLRGATIVNMSDNRGVSNNCNRR